MGRRRTKNKNLPQRVYPHHGSWRYVPKQGKPITLARIGDYGGMLRALAKMHGEPRPIRTMADLFDRYELEVIPEKGDASKRDNPRQLANLRKTFGAMDPKDLDQPAAAQYRDLRAKGSEKVPPAPTAANRELELLSHVCTMAVEWGVMRLHPLKGLGKISRPPRRRYVTDEEYAFVYNLASPMVRCLMDIALLTGLRRGDVFRLERKHWTEHGLQVQPGKTSETTQVTLLFERTPTLEKVIEDALKLTPQVRQYIVCNRKGKAFTKNGFDSVWNRLMHKACDPKREQHIDWFEFRDLRRKSASDEVDELVASQRLGHASVTITRRVYRVRPKKVRPLR